MAKLARLPVSEGVLGSAVASIRRIPRARPHYFAFLSYSHKDEEIADWLHGELEEFRVPAALAGKLTANGVTPKRLTPIFRDEHELAAADDLGDEIEEALSSSRFLIVLCSPNAAKSRWTNAEIEAFKRTRPDGCVLAAIAAGEPFASEIPGRENEECFPPALQHKYDRRGRPTGKRAEPLAADLREEGDGRRLGFLKLVAGMLGVGLDDLVQRETTRRHRRLAWLAAGSLAGMAVTSGLAITAIQARDAARDQRREAEGLITFMLGDLKDKLEPIGRLDALDGVGSRVLAYYSKQNTSELSDSALLQRSRALSLTAGVAYQRGDFLAAERLYREALQGTAEAVRRNPADPQRLFDHAQNAYWLGDIAMRAGELKSAEGWWREYKRLSTQMVTLAPDNMKWRVESESADANVGVVLYNQRRFTEAGSQFEAALGTIKALTSADPNNRDYQKALVETLAWLADARQGEGQLAKAIALRKRHLALLDELSRQSGGDVVYRQKLVVAHRGLATLFNEVGQPDLALFHFSQSVKIGNALIAAEPDNSRWVDITGESQLKLAETALDQHRTDLVPTPITAACQAYARLLSKQPATPDWRAGMRQCFVARARLALASGADRDAIAFAQRAVTLAKSAHSDDRIADAFGLAKSLRVLGDSYRSDGGMQAARQAWTDASAAIPQGVAELPYETAERLTIMERLGRGPQARELRAKLNAMGFKMKRDVN